MNLVQAKKFAEIIKCWSKWPEDYSIQYQNLALGEDWMDVGGMNFIINFGPDSKLNWRIKELSSNARK